MGLPSLESFGKKMKRPAILLLFSASIGLIVWDQVIDDNTGATFQSFTRIGSVFACASGMMLMLEKLLESKSMKIGSEGLPPVEDVAQVIAKGAALADSQMKILLKSIRKSKRASTCGKVTKEIPFEIIDRWGGSWTLVAYEEVGGQRGFRINRVAYSGKAAEVVARCIGI